MQQDRDSSHAALLRDHMQMTLEYGCWAIGQVNLGCHRPRSHRVGGVHCIGQAQWRCQQPEACHGSPVEALNAPSRAAAPAARHAGGRRVRGTVAAWRACWVCGRKRVGVPRTVTCPLNLARSLASCALNISHRCCRRGQRHLCTAAAAATSEQVSRAARAVARRDLQRRCCVNATGVCTRVLSHSHNPARPFSPLNMLL
jgi:hypothetical protein